MQPQDGGRSGDERSDSKLVLVNAAARGRRVDFWFRVDDRRSGYLPACLGVQPLDGARGRL